MKIKSNDATGRMTFVFEDDVAPVTFDCNQAHFDLCIHAMMKGFESRIKDTAAIPRKQGDSIITVTEAMRREKVAEMVQHLEAGGTEWNLKASARRPVQNTAILALAASLGKSYEEAEAHIAELALKELG